MAFSYSHDLSPWQQSLDKRVFRNLEFSFLIKFLSVSLSLSHFYTILTFRFWFLLFLSQLGRFLDVLEKSRNPR